MVAPVRYFLSLNIEQLQHDGNGGIWQDCPFKALCEVLKPWDGWAPLGTPFLVCGWNMTVVGYSGDSDDRESYNRCELAEEHLNILCADHGRRRAFLKALAANAWVSWKCGE